MEHPNRRGRPRATLADGRLYQFGFRLEIWLKQALDDIAKRQERTMTQVVRQACKEYVERERAKQAA